MVPWPIDPLDRLLLVSWHSGAFDNLPLEGRLGLSCLDTRRASRRSMRSLHWSSSCFKASIKAFSVSVRGEYVGGTLFALCS